MTPDRYVVRLLSIGDRYAVTHSDAAALLSIGDRYAVTHSHAAALLSIGDRYAVTVRRVWRGAIDRRPLRGHALRRRGVAIDRRPLRGQTPLTKVGEPTNGVGDVQEFSHSLFSWL